MVMRTTPSQSNSAQSCRVTDLGESAIWENRPHWHSTDRPRRSVSRAQLCLCFCQCAHVKGKNTVLKNNISFCTLAALFSLRVVCASRTRWLSLTDDSLLLSGRPRYHNILSRYIAPIDAWPRRTRPHHHHDRGCQIEPDIHPRIRFEWQRWWIRYADAAEGIYFNKTRRA